MRPYPNYQEFKNEIKKLGRELYVSMYNITTDVHYDNNDIYSLTYEYEGGLTKSMMQHIQFETNIIMHKGDIIQVEIGYVAQDNNHHTLPYGTYIVTNIEDNKDKEIYTIDCYDYIIKSMTDYEDMKINYPISISNYLKAICTHLEIPFDTQLNNFANANQMIQAELFTNQSITYRDILDYISEVAGGSICMNPATNTLEVKYPTNTGDVIDETFLSDKNVEFGEMIGKINSIVLSRSAESDNVYLQDTESVELNGLCEYKIIDNQIMNFNDRSNYLPDILNKLDGIEFVTCDVKSVGVMVYDYLDFFNIQIGDNNYKCLMLNDRIKIKNGLEEYIYADVPNQTTTDYSKADKTDRRINNISLIVDKQNQTIDAVVESQTETNTNVAQIELKVDELNSRISDIADITIAGDSIYGKVELEKINASEPIMIKVHPVSTTNDIAYIYPNYKNIGLTPSNELYPQNNIYPELMININDHLYPSNELYPRVRMIKITNTANKDQEEVYYYTIPMDLLFYDNNYYDEFILSYDNRICRVIKRVGIDDKGKNKYPLGTEIIYDFDYPQISLMDGDYKIELEGYEFGYIFVRMMTQNQYTTQFATKSELSTSISQTTDKIELSTDAKLSNYSTTTEMNSAITLKANEINGEVRKKVGENEIISKINQTAEQIKINADKISLEGKQLDLTTENMTITSRNFNVNSDGKTTIKGRYASAGSYIPLTIYTDTHSAEAKIYSNRLMVEDNNITASMIITDTPKGSSLTYSGAVGLYTNGGYARFETDSDQIPRISVVNEYDYLQQTNIYHNAITCRGTITAQSYDYYSLESMKKDIEKLDLNSIDLVKNSELYTFRYKTEDDNVKKHIGFIIGDNYKTPKEIISNNENGIDSYNMVSLLWKAVQEQQKIIEELQKQINDIKEEL